MKCLEQKYGENNVVWVTSVCLWFLNGRIWEEILAVGTPHFTARCRYEVRDWMYSMHCPPAGTKILLFWSGSPYINPYNNQRGRCSVIIIIIIIIITYMTLQLHQESITSQKIRQWIRMIQFIWTAQLRAFPNQTSVGPDSLTTGLWPCRWISQDERTKVATDAQLLIVLVIQTLLMSL